MKKIVVVDDEKDLCFLMKTILEGTGQYQVFMAHDGKSGIELCEKEKPDLIFLDFVMPVQKGDAVVAFLKKNPETRNIPVILMSGLGEMVYFEKNQEWKWLPNTDAVKNRGEIIESLRWEKMPEEVAKKMGISTYLAKPFYRDSLLEVTEKILGMGQKNNTNESGA